MSSNYDKQQWQAEQAARDSAHEKQREKERKTRERAARNARRKLERLHKTLSDKGEITDFENEFGESVDDKPKKYSGFKSKKKNSFTSRVRNLEDDMPEETPPEPYIPEYEASNFSSPKKPFLRIVRND